MSWLMRWLQRGRSPDAQSAPPGICSHSDLRPRWEKSEDTGKVELASGYTCALCGQDFTLEEAQARGV